MCSQCMGDRQSIANTSSRLRKGCRILHQISLSSGKKEPKRKLFGLDIFGWGGGLPREGVGAKTFGMSFETQGNQTFWRDIPGSLPGYLDDRQITHLIYVHLRHLLYDLGGVLSPFCVRKTTGRRPKAPPKKSYS